MRTRTLFFIGLGLLLLAAAGGVVIAARSPGKKVLSSNAKVLAPTLEAPTPTRKPTNTPAPTRTLTPGSPMVYVVKPGDTVFSIARRYGISPQVIVEANRINPDAIQVGQALKIPSATQEGTPSVTPTTTNTPQPTDTTAPPLATTIASPTPAPTVVIEAEWPPKMEIGRSDSIRISLIRTAGQTFVPTIEIGGHTVAASTPVPIGTPGSLIGGAFGPEYDVFVTANLAGTAFDASPVTAEEYQWVEQPKITWEWNITPKNPGPQVMSAAIQVKWKSKETGQTIEQPIWLSRLDISVERPWVTIGQINILSVLAAFLGSGLSVPWLYERVKEQRAHADEKSKRNNRTARRR